MRRVDRSWSKACRRCVNRVLVLFSVLCMDGDGSYERGNIVAQWYDAEPVRKKHCLRVGFVDLTKPSHVVSGDKAAVLTRVAIETVVKTRRDGVDLKPSDTRVFQSHAVHAAVALASINTDRLPAAPQQIGRRTEAV